MGDKGRGWRLWLTVGAAVMLPVLAACQNEAPKAPPSSAPAAADQSAQVPDEVRVTVKEWGFEPAKVQMPVGRPVTLILENQGKLAHDLSIPVLRLHLHADAGETVKTTITADKAGEYDLDCSLAGHKEQGMRGKLIVARPEDLRSGGAAQAGKPASGATHVSHAAVATTQTHGNQPLKFRMEGNVKVFDMKAEHVKWEVLPGEFVDAYAYDGQVPGPVMRVTEGETLRLNFTNNLPEPTVLHFHGPALPNNMDGVPDVTQKVIEPGKSFVYEFVAKPAGTFIYHTHHNSAYQEPKGLYGMIIIDPRAGTPVAYDKEVFQVVSELEGNYVINGKAFPATEPIEGKVGQKILIRLANLGQMSHPMHLHGHPFKIVATDGYPVPEAVQLTKDVVNIGPGERYDLLLTLDNPGTWVFHCHILGHVQNHGVEPGGMISVIKVTE